eukprot:augustus_masked-scaffold_33-processed-gene-3.62-mRNA-1 protein AED:1.00 eAED:1.00 QI:0/0/0/0/1/1/3/0/437
MANSGEYLQTVFDLSSKTILITGASSGIGAHFAETVLKSGCTRVVLAARRLERLEDMKVHFATRFLKAKICVCKCDVSDRDQIVALFDKVEQELGSTINVVINNAGVMVRGDVFSLQEEDFDKMLSVNLKSVYYFSTEAAARFKNSDETQDLSIINISSAICHVPHFGNPYYASTKAAINHATRALQQELVHFAGKERRIRVNAISPGVFVTEINEDNVAKVGIEKYNDIMFSKRVGKLEELDGPMLLLASDAGGYILGANIIVDGVEFQVVGGPIPDTQLDDFVGMVFAVACANDKNRQLENWKHMYESLKDGQTSSETVREARPQPLARQNQQRNLDCGGSVASRRNLAGAASVSARSHGSRQSPLQEQNQMTRNLIRRPNPGRLFTLRKSNEIAPYEQRTNGSMPRHVFNQPATFSQSNQSHGGPAGGFDLPGI